MSLSLGEVTSRPDGSTTPSVATLILSFGNPEDTIRCAESVIKAYEVCAEDSATIVIIDNGSPEKDLATLKEWHISRHGPVRILALPENAGYSAGINAGLAYLSDIEECPSYIWLLNNDLVVDEQALNALTSYVSSRENAVIVGPTVLDQASGRCECAGGCRYYPLLGYAYPALRGRQATELPKLYEGRIDYIYGAAIMINSSLLKRLGGLDTSYFLYFEELELARQLTPPEEMAWCREATVYHKGGGSSSMTGIKHFKIRQAMLSALIFTRRYHPWAIPTVILTRLAGLMLRGIWQRDIMLPLIAVSGAMDFFTGQKSQQQKAKVKDQPE